MEKKRKIKEISKSKTNNIKHEDNKQFTLITEEDELIGRKTPPPPPVPPSWFKEFRADSPPAPVAPDLPGTLKISDNLKVVPSKKPQIPNISILKID
jgi:hypothetical protein